MITEYPSLEKQRLATALGDGAVRDVRIRVVATPVCLSLTAALVGRDPVVEL